MKYPDRPEGLSAVLELLRFGDKTGSASEALADLSIPQWNRLLRVCDEMQITLPLARRQAPNWPAPVRERLNRNRKSARERMLRLRDSLGDIDREFQRAGIEYVVLKGLAHGGDYCDDPLERQQLDIDLYIPSSALTRATEALEGLGFVRLEELEGLQPSHLAPMVSDVNYEWTGDYFDPGIPVAVEPHFRFWDAAAEGFAAPGLENIWERRRRMRNAECEFSVLHETDEFTFRALHVLRHLLHGNLRIQHVWELARFLDERWDDCDFWAAWRDSCEPATRKLAVIAGALASEWFACRTAEIFDEERRSLDETVKLWLERYADAPLRSLGWPNKHELWLHLSLADRPVRILTRRLFPLRAPKLAEARYVPPEKRSLKVRAGQLRDYARYVVVRSGRHLAALAPILAEGAPWWWSTRGFGAQFLPFLAAAGLFTFGMFLFVLLYNLHLMDLGFEEEFLGLVAGTMTAGSIAGALPAGWLGRVIGLRWVLVLCFGGSAAVCAARATVTSAPALLGTAFLGGLLLAAWMVSMAPAVARLTTKRNRPLGFSLFFGAGIGLGILGGAAGGRLPEWLLDSGLASSDAAAKQGVLLMGCGFMLLAAVAALRLGFPGSPEPERRIYPRGRFIRRYLAVFAIWNLAVGAFNPFFNAYLARLGASTAKIGVAFSAGQAAQLLAIAMAPVAYRRFGLAGGIGIMMVLTGAAFGWLALAASATAGILAYCAFMAFQWMSEPGMYSLLMDNVRPEEQSGASSLNFLVIASAQAISAAVAGAVFQRFGYSMGLAVAGGLACVAGLFLRRLLGRPATSRANSSTSRR